MVDGISLAGLDHVMVVTAVAEKVLLRHYLIQFKRSPGAAAPAVSLLPMGPHADLTLRRTKFAATDLWKAATRKPRQ